MRKLLIVQVAALGADLLRKHGGERGKKYSPARTVFPAVTCPVQASFRTASMPSEHGMIANGVYTAALKKILFWEQSASLVSGERIWEKFRASGGKAGMYFWQQSLGEAVDSVLSPAPVHKHSGGMIQACFAEPRDLYGRLKTKVGRDFNLMHYWGPLASHRSSDWIVSALEALLGEADAPDLIFGYLPHLDYGLQKFGPEGPKTETEILRTLGYLDRLEKAAMDRGYEILFYGDYAIEAVTGGAVFPNRALAQAGLFRTRTVKGMLYPDFFTSRAFAMADHQVAHVYAADEAAAREARAILSGLEGVEAVMGPEEQRSRGVGHPASGRLVLEASAGWWFAYPWFEDRKEAPDFATHVDIHNKPGFDPCELFFGWPPLSVSMDSGKVKGTHGRNGPGLEIAWKSSLKLGEAAGDLTAMARGVRDWLSEQE